MKASREGELKMTVSVANTKIEFTHTRSIRAEAVEICSRKGIEKMLNEVAPIMISECLSDLKIT